MITCLGQTFPDDDARREHFRNELRKQLPELKKLEGFPIGEDEDIIALSDPPYYTACPNPWLDDFIAEWEAVKVGISGRTPDFDVQIPYAADVSEGKSNAIYNAHSYHTKVPHPAIMRYILHYTQPGDIVLDGFAGTGMTGVAAQLCGNPDAATKYMIEKERRELGLAAPVWGARRAICGDLSPIASFIAYNYNTPVDVEAFEKEAQRILAEVEAEYGWMYETTHLGDKKGKINYTVWSDVFQCDQCNGEIIFWKAAVDTEKGEVREAFLCPHCDATHTKRNVTKAQITLFDRALGQTVRQAKTVPVLINYTFGTKRFEKIPDQKDVILIEKINEKEATYWFPTDALPKGDKMSDPFNKGVTHVNHFYTNRNLRALSLIKNKINNSHERHLPFWFTSTLPWCGKENRLHLGNYFNKGGGVITSLRGTWYIASLSVETNVFERFSHRITSSVFKFNSEIQNVGINVQSANDIRNIKNGSVDYIFTDPPFGANLMYSELNFVWESWLKIKTNNKSEAIENKTQGKTLLDYQNIMTSCFREYFRVLKSGKWMTVEFSNTGAAIWNGIQTGLQRAGFVIANVAALDKQKGSFNAVTNPTSVKQDLVISCYKPSEQFEAAFSQHQGDVAVWDFVREHLHHLPIHVAREGHTAGVVERDPRILYDRLITFYLMRGLPVPMDSSDFRAGLRQRFTEIDGQYFLPEQAQEYEQKKALTSGVVQASLFIGTENEGIAWLREVLKKPQTRADLHPLWMQAITAIRKGDVLPDLSDLLNENFIQLPSGAWRVPDLNETKDREALRTKSLLKEFARYVAELQAGKTKRLKEVRAEALQAGFRDCWERKDFATVVLVGDRIPANLLLEDEKLLMYYDIAKDRV
jgi:16S rRNA G966 N2-methylase RsmD